MGTVSRNQLRVNALEMLRRPGTSKVIELSVDPALVELDDPRLVPDSTIDIDIACESLSDGIVIHGRIAGSFHGECRRCLQPLNGRIDVEIHELYQVTISDPDAFLIENDQVDLAPMIRETVLLELPDGPLCTLDCAGLCAACGKDLNEGSCACPADSVDPRWSVLDSLRDQISD